MSTYCQKCGAMIPDGMDKCPQCGTELPVMSEVTTETESTSASPANVPVMIPATSPTVSTASKAASDKVITILGLAAGILSIIFSFIMLGLDAGYSHTDSAYGGDAYTGIQNAAASTARNIVSLATIVKFGLFAILFVGGLLTVLHFVKKLMEAKDTAVMPDTPKPVQQEQKLPEL